MNYMTPDLLARTRSQDFDLAEPALTEWESACARYNEHVAKIRASLPPAARKLLSPQYNLHDARVLAIALDEAPLLSILVERDTPGKPLDRFLELRYRLAGGASGGLALTKHAALVADGKPFGWWLYDEFDVVREGQITTLAHSILLTGGVELRVLFFGLHCRRVQKLLFPSPNLSEEATGGLELLPA
jgi:hypothetical protein